METKINIASILKDKPKGTKLYSPIFGECAFCYICEDTDDVCIKRCNCEKAYFNPEGLYNTLGEVMLFPSKEMRDWRKFSWKKGDVLVSNDGGTEVIFDKWYDDTYTSFYGKHYLNSENENNIVYKEAFVCTTERYSLEDKDAAQTYINTIEERLGGKLNLETLEIEPAQPEFKDGDIVCYNSLDGDKCIGIVKEIKNDAIVFHVDYNLGVDSMDFDVSVLKEYFEFYKSNDLDDEIALNEALHIRNKSWNKEKNILENLKPKVEMKPFDKVLVRDETSSKWRVNLFGYKDEDGYYNCVYANWIYCIPYEGNEHLLGTTKNVEG